MIPETKTLNVKIPKGVIQGQKIRLRGQGGAGFGGGPNGDLYMEVELEPHALFTVDGRDITLVLPVAPWEAALGAGVKVPTLGGAVNLTIPPNAQSGQKLRLKGRGLPGSVPGDQYVLLQIVMPPVDSAEDRALMETMRRQMPFNPRAITRSLRPWRKRWRPSPGKSWTKPSSTASRTCARFAGFTPSMWWKWWRPASSMPRGDKPTTWRFSAVSVMRSRKALRLQRDLEINIPGLAVTLDLLDEVESLRAQVQSLKQQLEKLQR